MSHMITQRNFKFRFRISLFIVAALHRLLISFVSHRCISSQILVFWFFSVVVFILSCTIMQLLLISLHQRRGTKQHCPAVLSVGPQAQWVATSKNRRLCRGNAVPEMGVGDWEGNRWYNLIKAGVPQGPVSKRYYIQRSSIKQAVVIKIMMLFIYQF